MKPLTVIAREVTALRDMPADERKRAVADLLPTLEEMAQFGSVDTETCINLLTRTLRAVSPRAERPSTVLGAAAALRAAVETDRGVGRPAIGPPTTVRLPMETYEWLDEEARRRGILDRNGDPHRAGIIRAILEERRTAG